jgi:hypothetical protein
MLDESDVLLAVWDGSPPKPPGTGAIVQEACIRSIPVIWLASHAERAPVLIDRIDDNIPVASAQPWATALSLPARQTPATRV